MKKIVRSSIDPSKLVGKYIPKVMAKPFQLTKEHFEDVYKLTNSPRIGRVLAIWDKYEDPVASVGTTASFFFLLLFLFALRFGS